MHNLVPHFIQENFKAGKFQGQFPAVGLFLDISGFSTMTEALMVHGPHGAPLPQPPACAAAPAGRLTPSPIQGKGKIWLRIG